MKVIVQRGRSSVRHPNAVVWRTKARPKNWILEAAVGLRLTTYHPTYTTFARIAGAQVPRDRPIDGIDQADFLLGKSEKSNREGFPVLVADRLEAIKWRNWKLVFYDEERDWWTPPLKLGFPKAFDLITDPNEEYPVTALLNTWSTVPALKIVADFEQSLKKHPPIAPGHLIPTRRPGRQGERFPIAHSALPLL